MHEIDILTKQFKRKRKPSEITNTYIFPVIMKVMILLLGQELWPISGIYRIHCSFFERFMFQYLHIFAILLRWPSSSKPLPIKYCFRR